MDKQIQPINNGPIARPAGQRIQRPPMQQAPALGPKEIVMMIRRHLLLIIIFTMLGSMAGGAGWYLHRKYAPKYRATAAINVLPPGDINPMSIVSSSPNTDYYYNFRNTKASYIKQQSMLEELIRIEDIRKTDWFKSYDGDISKILFDLKNTLGVNADKNRTLILVSMTCAKAGESALIANQVVDMFLSKQRSLVTKGKEADLNTKIVQKRKLQTAVSALEAQLEKLRGNTSHVNVQARGFTDYLNQTLEELINNENRLITEMSALETNIETLQQRADSYQNDEVLEERLQSDPLSNSMRNTIINLKSQLSNQLARFGDDHSRVKQTREMIRQTENDLLEQENKIAYTQSRGDLRRAMDMLVSKTAEMEILTEQKIEAQLDYKKLDNIRVDYARIEKQRNEIQDTLKTLDNNIEMLNLLVTDPKISKLEKFSTALPPRQMSLPGIPMYLAGGFMLGMMSAVGLAFAIEMLNDLLRTPSDIGKHLKVPLLGMICHSRDDIATKGIDLYHVVRQSPYSMMSECYRQLRVNLLMTRQADKNKTFFITSCKAGCGKTTVAVNLASTLVTEGKKVLFIDCNFRRPSTPTLFSHVQENGTVSEHPDYGLSNYLMGQCAYDDVIRHSGIDGLDIVDSGPLPSNPAEMLANTFMKKLLANCREMYDYVILDGPPLLISDAKTLASQVDGTVVVFNAGATTRGHAQRTLRELREINANIAGSVLVGVRTLKGGYFRESYDAYQDYQQVQIIQTV